MIIFFLCKLLASGYITSDISGVGDVTFKAPLGTVLYVSGKNTYHGNTTIIGNVVISSSQNLPLNSNIYLGGSPQNLEMEPHLALALENNAGNLNVEGHVNIPKDIISNNIGSGIIANNHSQITMRGAMGGVGINLQGNGSYILSLTECTSPLAISTDVTLK